LTFRLR